MTGDKATKTGYGSKSSARKYISAKGIHNNISFIDINDEYCWSNYGDFKVILMKSNGYINATRLCKDVMELTDSKKPFRNWQSNAGVNELLGEIAKIINVTVDELIITKITGSNELRGSYVHPALITHVAYWISYSFRAKVVMWIEEWKEYSKTNKLRYCEALSKIRIINNNNKEKQIQMKLLNKYGGKTEKKVPVGYIDLLTDDYLIEIKSYKKWLHAIGQLIGYGEFYPKKQKMLYLFDVGDGELSYVKKICKKHDIIVKVFD